jgi:hypothetical protein
MQALSGFQVISRIGPRRGRTALFALGALFAVVALAIAARPAGAAQAPAAAPVLKTCPSWRVLHNDRIGAAVFPAGDYAVTIEGANLDCAAAGRLFARFLEDFDGVLPTPWKVSAEGSGKAAFLRGSQPGFSVELKKPSDATEEEKFDFNVNLGTLCRNPFTVNHSTVIRPLRFTKGQFLIYLPTRSAITCEQAVVLFQRFLAASPNLPSPWKLDNQTATFFKPSAPARSAFRIEPLAGVGSR